MVDVLMRRHQPTTRDLGRQGAADASGRSALTEMKVVWSDEAGRVVRWRDEAGDAGHCATRPALDRKSVV